jgi:hypothetical protein
MPDREPTVHSMRCMICGADPSVDGSSIFRLNNKGQGGVWACQAHYSEAKARYFPNDDPNKPPTRPISAKRET